MASSETARLIAELSLNDKLTPGVSKALGSVDRLESGLSKVGRGAGQLGAGLSRAGTRIAIGIGAAVGGAAKAAIDFEDAFAGVRKTVDGSETELAALSRSFRDMATEIPIAATEFARIGELGGALGINVKDLDEFTETVALLGVTTDVSSDAAATALGQLGNVLKLTGDDYDNFASTLVDLGNKGASTESAILEVARRAGGSATLLEIAADKTLGWASAIANLGLQPELAGTALQNFFLKTQTIVSSGGSKLKTIAKAAGLSGKAFVKAFREDASGALESLVQGLGKLPKDQRLKAVQKAFGKGSGLTRAILGLAESYDKNLAPAIDGASEAWKENTALTEESQKRFDTVRSKIMLLKNGLIEAGITVGEGLTPALGGAASQLSDFLKDPVNKAALKKLGEDIGKAIDGIDWKEVLAGARSLVDVMKVALDFAKRLYDAFNLLPTPIKGAAAGFLVLNKLSGGLIGSGLGGIVGGIGETIARAGGAKLPGVGRLFAQPVFVTNFPPGFGTGLPGAAGKGGIGGAVAGLGLVPILGAAIAAALASQEVRNQTQTQFERAGATGQLGTPGEGPFGLVGAVKTLAFVVENWGKKPIKVEPIRTSDRTKDDVFKPAGIEKALDAAKSEERTSRDTLQKAIDNSKSETVRETNRGTALVTSTTRQAAATIMNGFRLIPPPMVSVNLSVSPTTINRTTQITNRYGTVSGDRHTNHLPGRPGGGS